MSQPLTDAINALTTYANSVTGASDTTLSDAVDSLVAGYGGGGGSGMPLLKSETVAANTRYVNIDLTPYLSNRFVILVINFELTSTDWLYYSIDASTPQTSGNYGNQKALTHHTIPLLYGDLGGFGTPVCVSAKDATIFIKYLNGTPNSFMINTYSASISIKAGSTYSIYGM